MAKRDTLNPRVRATFTTVARKGVRTAVDDLSKHLDNYMMAKPLVFLGSSNDDLRDFPAAARRAAGFELSAVQAGLMPSDFKPMPAVGPGAHEIRVRADGEWRVIYVARFARAVYALHAFQKKTRKTRQEDIDIARARYAQAKEAEK